jgi:hypothetical protein
MNYPKVYLVLDSCYAIKRWIKPADWMRLGREMGFRYFEASTDNEADPIFFPPDYFADWVQEVLKFQKESDMRVKNFFTGYQTYRTAGLAHPDFRVREKMYNEWILPLVKHATLLEAGIGFSLFAFPDRALQNPEMYEKTWEIVLDLMERSVNYAWNAGSVPLSVEQMYAPHQPPWTMQGSREYLKKLYARTARPSYITIDVGHQVGQNRFVRPGLDTVQKNLELFRSGTWVENMWLGPESAYKVFFDAVNGNRSDDSKTLETISAEMDKYPYLFATEEDSDTYRWLEELACWSPIIHMQQTNGITSHHAPFTEKHNKEGIIEGKRLLQTIARSFEKEAENGMPPKCDEICLSFEVFAANIDMNYDTIRRFEETARYWRQFVPEDGVPLDQLI